MRWYHFVLAAMLAYGLLGVCLTVALLEVWNYPLGFWLDLWSCWREPKALLLRLLHFVFGAAIVPLVFAAALVFQFCDRISEALTRRRWRLGHAGWPR